MQRFSRCALVTYHLQVDSAFEFLGICYEREEWLGVLYIQHPPPKMDMQDTTILCKYAAHAYHLEKFTCAEKICKNLKIF